ncbi:hypothetical protein RJ640_000704 [Escallonia rubra]|uniref:Uncharacterized protein n=1 Tax=Escallonia rubra TaxID=112253 RepID=A0AA88UCL7_9ASTE|nr:hypothetical protein RJ640_000704 [Escallonia rubra]
MPPPPPSRNTVAASIIFLWKIYHCAGTRLVGSKGSRMDFFHDFLNFIFSDTPQEHSIQRYFIESVFPHYKLYGVPSNLDSFGTRFVHGVAVLAFKSSRWASEEAIETVLRYTSWPSLVAGENAGTRTRKCPQRDTVMMARRRNAEVD